MKVCNLPSSVPYNVDYSNYDYTVEQSLEKEHMKALEAWLRQNGWSGKRTGYILHIPHADSSAQYMYADGPKAMLVLLPYCDAWDSPMSRGLTKAAILKMIRPQGD